jgi:DNA-binding MurR/RpiR family transcriptional regulator
MPAMPAADYEELKAAISARYPAMPKRLQAIARFALERPNDLALGTVAATAEAAGVQPSAMVRFANALGFAGFSQMQRIFRGRLVERSASYRERIEQIRHGRRHGAAGGPKGALHQAVAEALGELGHLEEEVSAAQLQAAIRLLARASRIHALAQRRAFPVAAYLAYALGQLELATQLVDGIGGMLETTVRAIAPDDVLFAVSFRSYSPEVVAAASACHARGVAVIAITDGALSPLKPAARVCFELGDDSSRPFRSLVAPLCLAQTLVVSTGHHLAGSAERRRGGAARAAA